MEKSFSRQDPDENDDQIHLFPKHTAVTVGNPRQGVERCQALIRSFHRGEFIGCSKVREKQQIKRRNIFSPASPDVRLGIVPRSKSSDDQQRNTFALAEEIRGLSLEKEIGLIARDKYESLGQLVHTWLARQVADRRSGGFPYYLLDGSGFCRRKR